MWIRKRGENVNWNFWHLKFLAFLTKNPTNQDSHFSWLFQTIWMNVRKSRNKGLQGIIFAWKLIQILLQSKLQKMDEKPKFMVLRVLFLFEVYIKQGRYLTGENSSWSGCPYGFTNYFDILIFFFLIYQEEFQLVKHYLSSISTSWNIKLKKSQNSVFSNFGWFF